MKAITDSARVAADQPLFYAMLALLVWVPLPLASNRIWAWSMMEAWVFLLAVVWLIQYLRGRVGISRPFQLAAPVTGCLAAIALWAGVQTLVLPPVILELLSPQALELHNVTGTEPTLTLNTFASGDSFLKSLCYLLLFSLTLLLVTSKKRMRLLAFAIVLSGVFQASYGALMTLSGLEYGFFIPKESNVGLATGTFVSRNHLAGYLEMCLAVGIGLMLADLSGRPAETWRDSLKRFLRTLLGDKARVRLGIVIMVVGLVLTHSRMGNTAFFMSLTAVGGFYLLAVRGISRNTLIFFVSLLAVDLLVIGNFFGIEEVAERLQQTSVESEGRVDVAYDTLSMVRDFPVTGAGAGSFYSSYPMYDSGNTRFGFYRHAHNDYLQFASELGIPAFLLLGFVVLASLWVAIQTQLKRRDRLLQGLGFASSMAIVALMVHSAVDFNLQIPANAATFVVLLAMAWVCRYWDPLDAATEL